MTTYVIAYDIGTTGVKTCLFEISGGSAAGVESNKHIIEDAPESGEVGAGAAVGANKTRVGDAAAPGKADVEAVTDGNHEDQKHICLIAGELMGYDLYVHENGGVEQDPLQWWQAMCATTKTVLAKSSIAPEKIAGISFCAQMQAVVLVDKDGNPTRRAMSYMDTRGSKQLADTLGKGFKVAGMNAYKLIRSLKLTGAVSGSVKDPVWKYKWVQENESDVFENTYKWLDVKDFLVGKACGRFVMSRDSAFATLLYDTRPGKACFNKEICSLLDVPMKHLPDICLSHDMVGGMTKTAAEELGLAEGTPVFSGGGDASLIGVGAGCTAPGDTHIYIGTSGWVSTVVQEQKLDVGSMIASIVGVDPNSFNCFAELETAGKCLEWVRDHIALDDIEIFNEKIRVYDSPESAYTNAYEYIMDQIKDIPAGSNGVIFTPWLHGNRCPFEDPDARGMFFNIGMETSSKELIHAVIEGVAFHLRWQLESMEKLTKTSDTIRLCGGGALAPLTCQCLADVLDRSIQTVDSPQNTGSVGAAAVTALGLGLIDTLDEIKSLIPPKAVYIPNKVNAAKYSEIFPAFKALYKNNKKLFQKLNRK